MSEPYDHSRWDREDDPEEPRAEPSVPAVGTDDVEQARENVFEGWPSAEDVGAATGDAAGFSMAVADESEQGAAVAESESAAPDSGATLVWRADALEDEDEVVAEPEEAEVEIEPPAAAPPEPEAELVAALEPESPAQVEAEEEEPEPEPVALTDLEPVSQEHAPGELEVPPGYGVLEGTPDGRRRAVAVVVARFNGEITAQLLESALDELLRAGVAKDAITVMPVPGAFELPIGAMALARTRRFACVVALGCVIRGDTPHFDYVASEAASGLQLAALETGVPVAFGVLTLDREEQATARIGKGAEAVRTALEMADLFSHLRAAAAR